MQINRKQYTLEKDTKVEVFKIFGDHKYFAMVDIDGQYPQAGKISHNINRDEYILVLEGTITITINDQEFILSKNEDKMVADGDRYRIAGKGKILVFVKDGVGGESKICTESDAGG